MKNHNKSEEFRYVPLNDYENYYYSNDIDVASTLICKGYGLVDIVPIGQTKATFIFKNKQTIPDAIEGFWSNRIEVKPLEFANARKNLKSRIYALKGLKSY